MFRRAFEWTVNLVFIAFINFPLIVLRVYCLGLCLLPIFMHADLPITPVTFWRLATLEKTHRCTKTNDRVGQMSIDNTTWPTETPCVRQLLMSPAIIASAFQEFHQRRAETTSLSLAL